MKLRIFQIFTFLTFVNFSLQAQNKPLEEVDPPYYIKSIELAGTNDGDQFPVLQLGEPLNITFDEIAVWVTKTG